MVERITGIPQDQFLKAAELYTSVRKNGDMKKVSTIIYAVGWTQHSFGTQIIRTAAMLQLLMGNVGRAGGGVNALRGHSNIQGATDMAGIFDILPGYLKMPIPNDVDLAAYLARDYADGIETYPVGVIQLLVEYFEVHCFAPEIACTACGDEGERLGVSLPAESGSQLFVDRYMGRHVRRQSQRTVRLRHERRDIGPDSQKNIEALKKADWLVVCEIYPDETSEFWRSPGITAEEMKKINTRSIACPARDSPRRMAPSPTRRAGCNGSTSPCHLRAKRRLDQDILAQIFLKVRELYRKEGGKFPDPILNLTWAYTNPSIRRLAKSRKRINGKALADITDPKTKV